MKNFFRYVILIAFYMIASLPMMALAKRGVESGGGGGIAWVGFTHPVLLDYFTIINSVDELPISIEVPSRLEITTNSPLLINKDNQDEIKNSNTAFAKAFKILDQWKKMPGDIPFFIEAAFKAPLSWDFTDRKLVAPPFYISPTLPKDAQIEVAAYYSKKDNDEVSVSISRPIWNQMQLSDQAGLLIHEALRQVQIRFEKGYNDETLQRITAVYLLCRPSTRLNYYMFYLLNNSPALADKIYGSFHNLIQADCRGIQ